MNTLTFDPETGFLDTTTYTDPATETEAREQLMSLHTQTQTYINDTLVPAIVSIEGATGDEEAIAEITAAFADKAPLDSPAFTGTVTIEGVTAATVDDIASTTEEVTLEATSWSDSTYTITNTLITDSSNQELIPAVGITSDELTALQDANIVDGGQEEGTLTLIAMGDVPTIDIPVRIIYRGTK